MTTIDANGRCADCGGYTGDDGVMVAGEAYLALLRSPMLYRLSVQRELCLLRDFIALQTGEEAEVVQDRFEARAAQPSVSID